MRGLVFGLIVILMVTIVVIDLPNAFADVTIVPDRGSGSSSDNCTKSKYGCYSPGSAIVAVGQKVIFSNTDSAAHTFTAGSAAEGPTGEFDTSTVSPGKSYGWTADVVGEIPYFCMVHPWMDGIVIVQEKSSTTSSTQTRTITNDPNKLDWSIIFVTTTNKCYSNHEKALDFYSSLTTQYFNKANIPDNLFYKQCITDDVMPTVIKQLTSQGDLAIIIPDYLMSYRDRTVTGSLGHYSSGATSIVSQAESFTPESKSGGWVHSHELAHFLVDWKGYSSSIITNAVHDVEDKYKFCYSNDTTLSHCTYLWDTIKTPSGKWFPVMSPDYVLQVAESMKPKSPTYQPPNIKDESITSLGVSWTVNGKDTSNGKEGDKVCVEYSLRDYHDSTYNSWYPISSKIIHVGKEVLNISGIPIAYTPKTNYVTDSSGKVLICEVLKLDSSNHSQNGYRYSANFDGDSKFDKTNAPTITINFEKKSDTSSNSEKSYFDSNIVTMKPKSQNVTVELYKGDQKPGKYQVVWVSGYVSTTHESEGAPKFELYYKQKDGWQFVKSKFGETNHTEIRTNFGHAGTYENGEYKIIAKYFSEIAGREISDTKYFKINFNSQIHPSTLSIPVTLQEMSDLHQHYQKIINSFQSPEAKKLVEKNVMGNSITVSVKEVLENFEDTSDRITRGDLDKIVLDSYQVIFSDMDKIIENAKIIEKQYENKQKIEKETREDKEREEEIQRDKKFKQIENELPSIQKQVHEKLDYIKSEIKITEKSLEKINSNSKESKKNTDKAWNFLKYVKEDVTKIEENVKTAEKQYSNQYYESAKIWYTLNENDPRFSSWKELEDDLKEISKIIEQATPKSCFLIWCW